MPLPELDVARVERYCRQRIRLYWRDRNLRFHRYEPLGPTPSLDEVLDEVTADPTAIFWG